MKQTVFMWCATLLGAAGSWSHGPAIGIYVYYLFAVLRPQYMWIWALPTVGWSQIVAVSVLGRYLLMKLDGSTGQGSLRWSSIEWLLGLFFIWIALSFVFAYDRDVAGRWLVEYLKIALMYFVAGSVLNRSSQLWVLYRVVVVSLGYIAWEVNMLYFFDGRLDIYQQGYGGLDNNGAGLLLAMGLPLAVHGWEASVSKWRWLFVAIAPFMLHAVLMTYSRGAMLSLGVGLVISGLKLRGKLALVGGTVALMVLVPLMAGQEIRARFSSISAYEEDGSAQSRLTSWRSAIDIANDYPVFGIGVRNSPLVSIQYGMDIEGRAIHSQYLQILADSGYPAALLYGGVLVSAWLAGSGVRRRVKLLPVPSARMEASMAAGAQASLATFAFGALFLSLEVVELPFVLILLLSLLSRVTRETAREPERGRLTRAQATAAVIGTAPSG